MTNDIVKRLRADELPGDRQHQIEARIELGGILNEAADHIEKLEAALRDIIDERGICGYCGKLATGEGKRSVVICTEAVLGFEGPCLWTMQEPKEIALAALGEKTDD